MKKLACLALLLASTVSPAFCEEVYEYLPDALPQESDPAWAALGNSSQLRGELVDGALIARTDSGAWSQWRLGVSADGQREFGDTLALQIPKGGALTVDFRVKLPADAPSLPCLQVGVSNGDAGWSVTFLPGEIKVAGVTKPIATDTAKWGDYRMVIEGTQGEFFCVNTQTSLKMEFAQSDYGQHILFGFPALDEGQEFVERSFELKALKWQPGKADRQFPQALEK